MSEITDQVLAQEYARAQQLYRSSEPTYLGKLALAVSDCQLPIDVGAVYALADEAIQADPERARLWAREFGALNVALRLQEGPSTFDIVSARTRPDRLTSAEVATRPTYAVDQLLRATEVDGPVTYLLATDGQPTTAEMALIQALHMVDTALVTGQYPDRPPLIRAVSVDELVRLRNEQPDVFIRTYGNVRGSASAPLALGAVVATATVERSGIVTSALGRARAEQASPVRVPELSAAVEHAAFVGITTAKRPHLGHGFLLAQAMALQPTVLLELNDQGPRVVQALARLAQAKRLPVEQVAALVSSGAIGVGELEAAYRTRDQAGRVPGVAPVFSLAAANSAYRELLARAMPPNRRIVTVADSELAPDRARLGQNPAFMALFGDTGMAVLLSQRGQATVVETRGQPTLAGLLAALATRYSLEICDRPQPLSQAERGVIAEVTETNMQQRTGGGILIDFEESSGTQGNVLLLEDLVSRIEAAGYSPKLLFPAIRRLLDTTPAVRSTTGSICPNFASLEAALAAFDRALGEVVQMPDPFALLERPVSQRSILGRELLRTLTADVYDQHPRQGKTTAYEVRALIARFPILERKFSRSLRAYLAEAEGYDGPIPKNFLTDSDRDELVAAFRSGTPKRVIPILLEQAKADRSFASRLFHESALGAAARQMGYTEAQFLSMLAKLQGARRLYRNVGAR